MKPTKTKKKMLDPWERMPLQKQNRVRNGLGGIMKDSQNGSDLSCKVIHLLVHFTMITKWQFILMVVTPLNQK